MFMNKSKIFLTFFLWICMVFMAMGQAVPKHQHQSGEINLNCRVTEANNAIDREKIRSLNVHGTKAAKMRAQAVRAVPPDDFEYVIPIVFHVFGTEFNKGTTVTTDLIRKALEETNKDFWGLQPEWNTIPPAREPFKCPLKITFRLAEKDPDGNPTTGVTFHDYETGFGNGGGYDEKIQKYAWDNYRYMNVYIMWDLYDDSDYVQSGVSWYPDVDMSNANLARVVYNGSYLGENAAIANYANFRCVLTHEFGHFLNLKHTFENCESSITYPNDEVDDTPAHLKDPSLQEGAKNPFGEVIDVANFMNYPHTYKNFTKGQVERMKAALQHEARFTLWQEETHEKVFYTEPAPRIEVSQNTVHEDVSNDGSFTALYKILLYDCNLKAAKGEYLAAEDYTVTDLPEGITLKWKVAADNCLEGELTGKFASHEAKDEGAFSVSFKNSMLSEGKILNPGFKLFYTFRDAYTIVHGESGIVVSPSNNWTWFSLGAGNAEYGAWYASDKNISDCYKLQSYRKPLVIYPDTKNIKPLALGTEIDASSDWGTPADEYEGVFDFKSPDYHEWVGQNAYVGIQFEINKEIIYGWMNISFNADGKGYTVHDWAYNTEPEASIKAGETAEGLLEKIQVSPGEIVEDIANDGTVNKKVSIRISGVSSEFTKTGVLVPGTDYTITNVPEGLSVKVSLTDKVSGMAEFSGKAVKHSKADGVTVKLVLKKELVSNPNIEGLNQRIKVTFKDPYGIFYKDIEDVWVAPQGSWTEFSFGIGNADFEAWYAEKLGGKFKLVSANNPLVAYKGTSNVVPLEFGETVGETLDEKMEWKQQKTGVSQPEIDESMLDLKTATFLEWVGKTAYAGVQFLEEGLVHYGWIGIRFEADGNMMTLEDWAYNEAPEEPIQAGYKKKDQQPYIAWPDTLLTETTLNDGSLDSLTVKVKGAEFVLAAGEKLTVGTHYTADALPAGLSLSVSVLDKVTARIEINGKAEKHAAADSVKDWAISFNDAAFTAAVSENAQKFDIYFRDPYGVVYKDIDDILCDASHSFTVFYPTGDDNVKYGAWYNYGELRLETYGKNIICTNSGESTAFIKPLTKGYEIGWEDEWNMGGDYPNEHWVWGPDYKDLAGKEIYLGFAFQEDGEFHFGWMRMEVAADGTSYVLKDYAYHTGPKVPIRAGDKGVEEPPFLVIEQTVFHEGLDNDGAVTDSVKAELVYGQFAKSSGLLVEGTDYTITNLPEGLTLQAELQSAEKLVLRVAGKAKAHDKGASVTNVKFTFTDAAFATGTEPDKKDIRLGFDFRDPYRVIYVDVPNIECSRYNMWTLLDIDGNTYGIWYDIDGGLALRLETYGAPLICEGISRNITPLKAGEMVGPASNWVDGGEWPDEHDIHNSAYTTWRGKEGYIGLKYDYEGRTRYGWLRIEVSEDGQSYIVKDYAYNEVFGEPIMTGAKERQDLMVSFTADKTLTYETFDVNFSNNTYSILPVESYRWAFEGGNPAVFEGEKPGKIHYSTAGTYDVSLKVTTADTTITFVQKDYIEIEPIMLKADFIASAASLVEGGKVNFTDASSGSFDIVKWEWSFEGGQPSVFEGQHPGEVTYATAGSYEVILKVTDKEGRIHTRFATGGVTVFPANYRDYCPVSVTSPTENTYCYITGVSVGEQTNESEYGAYTDYSRDVQFSARKGEAVPFEVELNNDRQGGAIAVWVDWNGDGVFDETTELVAEYKSSEKPENLVLTVPDEAAEGIVGMRVRVTIGSSQLYPCEDESYYGEVEDYSLVISPKSAEGDILADKQNLKKGEYVTFRADINAITDEGVEAYKWIFEGGQPAVSTERIPAPVQYVEEGVHPVVLELTLQGGEKKIVEKKNFIVVNPAVTLAHFGASATDVLKGGKVSFTDESESSAGIASWAWTFEGGAPASYNGQTPPEITYAQTGDYEVVLTVTDVNGQKNTRIEPLYVRVYENSNSYCTIAEGGSYYSIVKVALGDQQHVTPEEPDYYVNDFTDFAFVVEKNNALPFEIGLSSGGKGTEARVMAWVDWNQDGVFDENTECVAKYQDQSRPADLKITVPEDAKEGATRMRVRTAYYSYQAPCDAVSGMGGLGDYTIIVKKDRPSGYIVADRTNPAIGEEVRFTAFVNQMTDANVTGYKWTFTGGTPAQSTDRKPAAVTYAAEGTYDVVLELTLESGVKKNITMYDFITVGTKAPEVAVDFTASPAELFAGSSVDYAVSLVGNATVTAYEWTFEGATPVTATTQNPTVTYAASGNYDVTLTVTLNDGTQRMVKKSNYITVNPFLLKADFTASATKVNSGTDVAFSNASIGAESYSWDFGDGSAVSTEENPTHAFSNAGMYTVKLTVSGNGETHTKKMPIVVSAMKAACDPGASHWIDDVYLKVVKFGSILNDVQRTGSGPYFDFTGNEAFVMVPGESIVYELQFANNWSSLNVTVWIDWNDSGDYDDTEMVVNAALGDNPSIEGTITVPEGLSDRLVRMRVVTGYSGEGVTMEPCDGGGYSVEDYAVRIGAAGGDDDLILTIKSDRTTIRENETVTLSVDGAPEGAAYEWTLNGAETITSTEATPVVRYTTSGAYDVKVKVTPNGGNERILEESRFIIVNLAQVSADFTVDKTLCALGEEVHFTSTSTASADIQSLEWTFEGGSPATSTEAQPTVTYAAAGNYDVTLKVTDRFGKTDTKVMPEMIEAKEFIKADFTTSAMTVAVGEPVLFTNRSAAAVSYSWTFDNGEPATSTETSPTVTFKVAGAAMVTLIAEDASGKRSVKSEILEITPRAFGAIQLDDLVQDYDGTVKTVSCTTTPAALQGNIRIVYKQNGVEVSPENAGMYEVTATYVGEIPYSVEEVKAQLEIRPMPIRVVAADMRQDYTGEVLKAQITTEPAGYENLLTVNYLQDGQEVEPLNSGSYQIKVEANDPNYEVGLFEEEFFIRKIEANVKISLEKEYVYDGTAKTVRSIITEPAGLETEILYDGKEGGVVEVGEYTVTASVREQNYEGIARETMVVKPAEAEVKIVQDRFVYDGQPHNIVFTTVPENLEYEVSYSKDGETVSEVINGGIYQYSIRLTGENHSAVVTGEMEITKALAQIYVSGLRSVYDGETKSVKVETVPAGLEVEVTYNGFYQLPYAAGEYTVFAEIRDQNYRGYKTADLQIVKSGRDMKVMDLVVSDGSHDCIFRIPELASVAKSLVMYNQQGEVIYETKEYYDNFDMRDLPAGTYYYILQYVENGKSQAIKSFVEVIRK